MDRKWFLRLLGYGSIGSIVARSVTNRSVSRKTLKPNKLQRGDTIGLVSPASRLPKEKQYDKIIKQVKKLGNKVKVGKNARDTYGYFAGSDEQRAADLNQMFADNTVDAILPFRGGWGCNRILSLIDYETIRNNPKILVGFSDITSLLNAIYAKTGLITFHGPVGKVEWTDYTIKHFRNALGGEDPYTLDIPKDNLCKDCKSLSVITPGKAKGKLLGGNLSVLTAMMGSDYTPEWGGNILFLEDVGEDVYRIDRMLTQLKLNGVFDKISGFVFGQCAACDRANSYSLTLQQVFDDHIKPFGIPAYSGAMIGHISKMGTLPVGMPAEINAQEGTITLAEAATI